MTSLTLLATRDKAAPAARSAGVFAVAQHRQIQAAAAFSIADSLPDRIPRRDSEPTREGLRVLLDAATRTLNSSSKPPQKPREDPL